MPGPERPLAETVCERAELIANRQLANVEQNMRLEDQAVQGKAAAREQRRHLIEELLRRLPASGMRNDRAV
jgi:hypothetical protein